MCYITTNTLTLCVAESTDVGISLESPRRLQHKRPSIDNAPTALNTKSCEILDIKRLKVIHEVLTATRCHLCAHHHFWTTMIRLATVVAYHFLIGPLISGFFRTGAEIHSQIEALGTARGVASRLMTVARDKAREQGNKRPPQRPGGTHWPVA